MSHYGGLQVTLNESSGLVLPAQCCVIGDDLRWQEKENCIMLVVENNHRVALDTDGIIWI